MVDHWCDVIFGKNRKLGIGKNYEQLSWIILVLYQTHLQTLYNKKILPGRFASSIKAC